MNNALSILKKLGGDSSSSCCCYQAKVKSTPSLKPKSGVWQKSFCHWGGFSEFFTRFSFDSKFSSNQFFFTVEEFLFVNEWMQVCKYVLKVCNYKIFEYAIMQLFTPYFGLPKIVCYLTYFLFQNLNVMCRKNFTWIQCILS